MTLSMNTVWHRRALIIGVVTALVTTLAGAGTAQAAAADGSILPAGTDQVVADSYVVLL